MTFELEMRWLRRRLTIFRENRLDRKLGIAIDRVARRVASNAFYVGDNVIMTRVLGRYILYLPSRDLSLVPGLLLFGRWEISVTRTLASLLRPGMIVGDVGANVGYFTALMAASVGASGHVHAFEPNPDLCSLIGRSLFANGYTDRVTVHQFALGSEDGAEMLLCFPAEATDALGSAATYPLHDYPHGKRVTVRRLDTIPGAETIELLKIDAESAEPAIWAGMDGLLNGTTLRTVLIEYSPGNYADPAGFLGSIRHHGFDIELIDPKRGIEKTTTEWLLDPQRHGDTLMLLLRR